jgi:hypothetical protein
MASAPVGQSKIAAAVQLMRQRIEALSIEREVWETTAYVRSNDMLYGLIQKSYELYIDLTNGMGDAADKKVGFKDYINLKGYSFKESTPLTGKIIRCVFGDKDRRRLSTYHTVLRVIVANKWAVADVPSKIAEFGGVQEISMGKPLGHLTPLELQLPSVPPVLLNLGSCSSVQCVHVPNLHLLKKVFTNMF